MRNNNTLILTNEDRVKAIDQAWNERRWSDYKNFFSDELVVFMNGETNPQNKSEFLIVSKYICKRFPDNRILNESYLNLFSTGDGEITCSVAWVLGTRNDEFKLGNNLIVPSACNYAVTIAVVRSWREGRVIMQRHFFDLEQILSQYKLNVMPMH